MQKQYVDFHDLSKEEALYVFDNLRCFAIDEHMPEDEYIYAYQKNFKHVRFPFNRYLFAVIYGKPDFSNGKELEFLMIYWRRYHNSDFISPMEKVNRYIAIDPKELGQLEKSHDFIKVLVKEDCILDTNLKCDELLLIINTEKKLDVNIKGSLNRLTIGSKSRTSMKLTVEDGVDVFNCTAPLDSNISVFGRVSHFLYDESAPFVLFDNLIILKSYNKRNWSDFDFKHLEITIENNPLIIKSEEVETVTVYLRGLQNQKVTIDCPSLKLLCFDLGRPNKPYNVDLTLENFENCEVVLKGSSEDLSYIQLNDGKYASLFKYIKNVRYPEKSPINRI